MQVVQLHWKLQREIWGDYMAYRLGFYGIQMTGEHIRKPRYNMVKLQPWKIEKFANLEEKVKSRKEIAKQGEVGENYI